MSYIQAGGGSSGRSVLTGNKEFYITTTGSDSNPGTLAAPWATLQHAMNVFSSQLDSAGFLMRANIGTGTFVGVGFKAYIGGGNVEFKGNGTANTIIDNGPADGVFNGGEPFSSYPANYCAFWINELTCKPSSNTGNAGAIYTNTGPTLIIVGQDQDDLVTAGHIAIDSTNNTVSPQIVINGPDAIYAEGETVRPHIALTGNAVAYLSVDIGGHALVVANFTLTGTPAYSSDFVDVDGFSGIECFNPTFTGAATGTRFNVFGTSFIVARDSAGTLFPGNAVGVIAPGGLYTGITDFIGPVGSLPTANIVGTRAFVNDALTATFGSAPTGGHGTVVPVYNTGSGWLMG